MSALVDLAYFAVFVLAGLASVRVVGLALNVRDRRRHVRCLANIARLEAANGYSDGEAVPKTTWYVDVPRRELVYPSYGSGPSYWAALHSETAEPDSLWRSNDGVDWQPVNSPSAATGGERGTT